MSVYQASRSSLTVEFKKLDHRAQIPRYMTEGASGLDVTAVLDETLTLLPLARALIPTGLSVALPLGYEIQIRPRSGLALKHGITCLNTPGTIDADYRGEIKVLLINLSDTPYVVSSGERIAQLIVQKVEHAQCVEVETLPSSLRGDGGFGHTGI